MIRPIPYGTDDQLRVSEYRHKPIYSFLIVFISFFAVALLPNVMSAATDFRGVFQVVMEYPVQQKDSRMFPWFIRCLYAVRSMSSVSSAQTPASGLKLLQYRDHISGRH